MMTDQPWVLIKQRIDDFLAVYPTADFGPAHITLSDGNFGDSHLLSCLRETFKELGRGDPDRAPELSATVVLLLLISETPEALRDWPRDESETTDASAAVQGCDRLGNPCDDGDR